MKIFFVVLFFLTAAFAFGQQKFALVIGNADYTGISKLRNPVNDANGVASALQSLGFTVDKVLNGNLDRMETAVDNFRRKLGASRNAYGFFFYAGHGVQSNGDNYLIPVDANNIQTENHLRQRAVSVQTILENINDAGNELNIIVLDACRDNPFGWARSGSRGLSVLSHTPAGSIIMYATSAGSTADDGTGNNGLFTTQLLNNLKTPGLSVRDVFDKTGEDVLRVSNGRQHPELSVRFFGASSAYLGSKPEPQVAPQRIFELVETVPKYPPNASAYGIEPELITTNNMVRIEGGTFMMGSPANEPGRNVEEGQHQVTVSGFYMGKYQVTQKEYQEVMGRNPSSFIGDNLPVEKVSWFDAIEYCNRLSQREGLTPAYTRNGDNVTWNRNANGYRLPTEAEWEYACRAGTTTIYNTGNSISDNTGWYSGNSGRKTHPVGQKPANAWGLYDMHGNLYEWCWDWGGNYFIAAVTNPVGASSGQSRVIRGGNWDDSAQFLRSASRFYWGPFGINSTIGFRLVRP